MAIVLNSHQEIYSKKKISKGDLFHRQDWEPQSFQNFNDTPNGSKAILYDVSFNLFSAEIIKYILHKETNYPEVRSRQLSEWYYSRTREAK